MSVYEGNPCSVYEGNHQFLPLMYTINTTLFIVYTMNDNYKTFINILYANDLPSECLI